MENESGENESNQSSEISVLVFCAVTFFEDIKQFLQVH